MRKGIMSMFSGAPAAVAVEFARDLLAMDMPQVEARQGQPVAAAVERFTVQRGIAVVPVRGILTPNSAMLERWFGWSTYFGIADALDELTGRADVSAIILDIDSPGGLVTGCEGAAAAVAAALKPVHALAVPLAASAAYWIGSQASTLAVIPGGIVGSIGVAMIASSIVGPDNWGEQQYALTSSHARAKRPDPGTEEGMTELRRWLDEYEAVFHAAVASGRGLALDDGSHAQGAGRITQTAPRLTPGGGFFVSCWRGNTVIVPRYHVTLVAPLCSHCHSVFGGMAGLCLHRCVRKCSQHRPIRSSGAMWSRSCLSLGRRCFQRYC